MLIIVRVFNCAGRIAHQVKVDQ